MREFSVAEAAEAAGGKIISGTDRGNISAVVTDSRRVTDGVLFVAFSGESFDGHDYIDEALRSGAAAVLSEREIRSEYGTVIKVGSTLEALGKISAAYLKKYRIPVVGVTGSVGKTSTKDMVAAVLESKYRVLKSTGNHNNEIGMPMTILSMEEDDEAAVLEMGMSAFGELHYLADIARPDAAVITNIGMSHIENLGSREGIFKAKLEICDFFGKSNTLFVNGDDEFLKTASGDFPIVFCGKGEKCGFRAEDVADMGLDGSCFTLISGGEKYPVRVSAPGVHNVYNALIAIAVGAHFGIDICTAAEAVSRVVLTDMRLTVEELGGVTILKDFYNAAPDSVRASLAVLKKGRGGRRVAVLGDIMELGEYAEREHRALGRAAAECADLLIAVGENSRYTAEGARCAGGCDVVTFSDTREAAREILKYKKDGDCILIKASRAMKFEKLYEVYKENAK